MKKFFYSFALVLLALMLTIPAHAANVYEAVTYKDLFFLLGQGYTGIGNPPLEQEDTIRLMADIQFSVGVTDNFYLYIPENTTRTLDLNGKTLKSLPTNNSSAKSNVIEMESNSTLNICDTKGNGVIMNDARSSFVDNNIGFDNPSFHNYTYHINSACIVNSKHGLEDAAAQNCTVNVYGGSIVATYYGKENNQCSSIFCYPDIVAFNGTYTLLYEKGGFLSNPHMTVNIYGGYVATIRSDKYTLKTYEEDMQTVLNAYSYWQEPDLHLHYFYLDYYSNPLTVNLLGGHIGYHMLEDLPALSYPKGFKGKLQEGTIYGIYTEDNLKNFDGVAPTSSAYVNDVKTSLSDLKTQDLQDKAVRFSYDPNFSVGHTSVTSENYEDILGDGTVRFDRLTNTLYLINTTEDIKTLDGGIYWTEFDMTIDVQGKWTTTLIECWAADLTLRAHHRTQLEEQADMLSLTYKADPALETHAGSVKVENRLKLVINAGQNAAVHCDGFTIEDSWLNADGTKPVVNCKNSYVVNATVTNGSFKEDASVRVEPNIRKYVVVALANDDNAGVVTGDGLYPEGTDATLVAVPIDGYQFLRWSDGNENAQRVITVTEDVVLYALFEALVIIPEYTIDIETADIKMGLVSGPTGTFEESTVLTFEAIPSSGYEFLYWMDSQNQVVSGSAVLKWTLTKDEVLTAHFRVKQPDDAYTLWVCGKQVTGSNSRDILGDGVWSYDNDTRTLTVMKDANYEIYDDGFIEDWAGSDITEPLIVKVGNHKIEATCTTTDNVIRNAIVGTKGMTFTGTTYHGITLTAQNMYAANFSKPLTVTGHMDLTLNLQNTTDWGREKFKTAVLLGSTTPSLIVNGANFYINSGQGESAGLGYKATNKTDQETHLSMINASIQWGSISGKDLGILDDSPKYEINYLTPSIESLCLTSVFGLSFFEGTYFNLYAYPQTGYKFVSWSDGNTDNPRQIIMPAEDLYLDPIVEIDNSQIPQGAIISASATEGQGFIANFTSGWYAEGAELMIIARPEEGYEFAQWSDGTLDNPYLLTVEANKNLNLIAIFREVQAGAGIESVQNSAISCQKILRDGQLFILRDGKIYNAQGAEVR